MSDYTPTTENVRYGYVANSSEMRSDKKLYEEFDRWLAGVKAEAVREFVESAIKPEKIKELSDMHLADSVRELQAQAWEEGCRWGAVEFQTLEGKLEDEDKVEVTDADNPYRGENK